MNKTEAMAMLGTDGITCIAIKKDGEALISRVRGVRPILGWIEEGQDLQGCIACDTIVGRAAALMYKLSGASEVNAKVMSEGGKKELEDAGIAYASDRYVEMILNRRGDGMCPMEQTVSGIGDPQTAFSALKEKIAALQASKPAL